MCTERVPEEVKWKRRHRAGDLSSEPFSAAWDKLTPSGELKEHGDRFFKTLITRRDFDITPVACIFSSTWRGRRSCCCFGKLDKQGLNYLPFYFYWARFSWPRTSRGYDSHEYLQPSPKLNSFSINLNINLF